LKKIALIFKYYKICVLPLVFLFLECSAPPPISFLPALNNDEHLSVEWEKYGAYFDTDETQLCISNGGMYSVVHKRIKILSTMGSQYGTIPIPYYSNTIDTFLVSMTDSSGNNVKLNRAKMRQTYKSEGKVIFPNVTKGCCLNVKIKFNGMSGYLPYTYSMRQYLPVAQSKFMIYAKPLYPVKTKLYSANTKVNFVVDSLKHKYLYTYSAENILPLSETRGYSWEEILGPRIDIHYLILFSNRNLDSWDEIAIENKLRHALSITAYDSICGRREIKLLTNNIPDTLQKAKAIYEYIQTKFEVKSSTFPYDRRDLWTILKRQSGDQIELARLCRFFLKKIGIPSTIVYSRMNSLGGFDTGFVNMGACQTPFVIATIKEKPYALYFGDNCAGFGSYPLEFFNNYGLDMFKGNVVKLPEPTDANQNATYFTKISSISDEAIHEMKVCWSDYTAYLVRYNLKNRTEQEIRMFAINELGSQSVNQFRDYKFSNTDSIGDSLCCTITFNNNNISTTPNQSQRVFLRDYVKTYYNDFERLRKTKYTVLIGEKYNEIIEIAKENKKKYVLTGTDNLTIENKLFSTSFTIAENDINLTLTRKLVIKPVEIEPHDFESIYSDIQKLNSLRDAYVDIK
jgi:hypothetical protein